MSLGSGERFACVCLASLMLLGTFVIATPQAISATQDGDFVYELYGFWGAPTQANITDYIGPGGAVTIPSSLGGYPVEVIDDYALAHSDTITSVIVPSSVNLIGYCCFYHCDKLSWVTLGSGVGTISYGAFYGCPLLANINFLGLVAPTSVGGDWVNYTSADIRGHAHSVSNFPAPGGDFHGLRMGDNLPIDQSPPGAPEDLTATSGVGFISLAWDSPTTGNPSFSHYDVYRRTGSGAYGSPICSPSAGSLSCNDSSVTVGVTYRYVVKAVNQVGSGPPSNEASATATAPPSIPSAPRFPSAMAGRGCVTLSWSAPASEGGSAITNFMVYRGSSSGGEVLLVITAPLHGYTDLDVVNGRTYYYQISAANGIGEGPRSSEASATPCTVPGPPTLNGATAGVGSVSLTWSPPEDYGGSPITNYQVLRGATSGGEQPLELLENVLEFADSGLANGVRYYYRVSALNSVGYGLPSNELWAIPSGPPSAPRGLHAIAGDGSVELNWTEPAYVGDGPIVYHVFRNGNEIWSGSYTTIIDASAANGVEYSYSVSASNGLGSGPRSEEVLATPRQGDRVPTAVRGFVAADGLLSVRLNWTSPLYVGPGTLTYNLFRDWELIWSGTANEYVDQPLAKGVDHVYSVAPENSLGWGPNCTSAIGTAYGVPDEPWGLIASSVEERAIRLAWNPVNYSGPGELQYSLFRNGSLLWSGTDLKHNDPGLAFFVEYSYSVSARNSIGYGPNSSTVRVTPLPAEMVPSAPRNLGLLPGKGNVSVSWFAPQYSNASTVIEYELRYGSSPDATSNITVTADLSLVVSGLEKGHVYYFTVRARNSAGTGRNCSIASAIPFGEPGSPIGLVVVAGNGTASMNWGPPSYQGPGNLTYHVFRDGVLVWSGSSRVFQDRGLTKGHSYSYSVCANNSVGYGPNSTPASAIPFGVPSEPIGLNATVNENGVILRWDAPAYVGPGSLTYHLCRDGSPLWNGTGKTFLDAGATDHHFHNYTVYATNSIGYGANSSVVQAKITEATVETGTPPVYVLAVIAVVILCGAIAGIVLVKRRSRP